MNKNIMTILTAAATALLTGCVTAGTWVNGYYVDGPLCTVCDGTRVVAHAYGTTVCTHCDGTGVEPPEEAIIVENVIVDTWCPALPPRRTIVRRDPPQPHRAQPVRGGHRETVRPAQRHAQRPKARPTARQKTPPKTQPKERPAARPAGRPMGKQRRK